MPGPKRIRSLIVTPESEETPLQRANRLGVPLIPPKERMPFREHNPVIAVCGQCGHSVRSMEYRSCPQSECPFGSSITMN